MKINREALQQLLRVLDDVQQRELSFDLKVWIDSYTRAGDPININSVLQHAGENGLDLKEVMHTCGAAACACGYAALDPWFIEQGFRLSPRGVPAYETADGAIFRSWDAAAVFFFGASASHSDSPCEVGEHLADHLFNRGSYSLDTVTPGDVAERIRELLALGDDEAVLADWTHS